MASRFVCKNNKALETTFFGIEVSVIGLFCDVELVHEIKNQTSNEPIEVIYELALGGNAAVHSIDYLVSNKGGYQRIHSKLVTLKKGQNRYDDSISFGNSSLLVEFDSSTKGSVSLSLGNLLPETTVRIEVKYSVPALVHYSKTSSSLIFRFPCDSSSSSSSSSVQNASFSKLCASVSNIPGTVTSAIWDCFTPLQLQKDENNNKFICCSVFTQANMSKPSILKIELCEMERSGCFVTTSNCFFAWCGNSKSETESQENSGSKRLPIDVSFILDRSGSMQGESISCAKEALLLLVASLPLGSYFNILGFGSSIDSLFEEGNNQQYNDETLAKAREWICDTEANLGGTEILEPLAIAVSQRQKRQNAVPNLPHVIVLLTDGCVSDNSKVLSFVRDNAGYCTDNRVFALGIGRNVSRNLIEGIAQVGAGNFAFVTDINELQSVVMSFLDKSTLCFEKFPEIIVNSNDGIDNQTKAIQFFPTTGTLFGDEVAMFYALNKENVEIKTVHFKQKSINEVSIITKAKIMQFPTAFNGVINRCATFAIIQDLLKTKKEEEEENKEEIIQLSIENNVLCSLTSFIAISENQGVTTNQSMTSLTFPASESASTIAKHAKKYIPHETSHYSKTSQTSQSSQISGRMIMIQGVPCCVSDMSTSKTGKHGVAKVHIVARDPFTGKKLEDLGTMATINQNFGSTPVMERRKYTLVDIEQDFSFCSVLNEDFEEKSIKVSEILKNSGKLQHIGNVGNEEIFVQSLVIGDREELIDVLTPSVSNATQIPSTTTTSQMIKYPNGWNQMSQTAKICYLQSADGHWKLSALIEEALSLISEELLKSCCGENNENDKSKKESCWTTAVVICFLQQKLAAKRAEWEISEEKARQWLNSNCKLSQEILKNATEFVQKMK